MRSDTFSFSANLFSIDSVSGARQGEHDGERESDSRGSTDRFVCDQESSRDLSIMSACS
jgi:hypothetical protein